MGFEKFNFTEGIMEGIASMGFDQPTPIQDETIPRVLGNKDLIACAQTGTGKTAAYLLPVLQKIITMEKAIEGINTLIIVPTRELALQIDQQLEGFAYFLPISSISIYGGNNSKTWEQQKKAIEEGADIVVATPGRLISHLTLGYLKMENLQHLILDEADRMLDMGFYEDIEKIIRHLPENRQTLMFSATMPPKIRILAKKILKDPVQINIAVSKPAEGILQAAYNVYDSQKIELIKILLTGKDIESVLIFSSTKRNVKKIDKELQDINISSAAIHSDLEQPQREAVLRDFKNRKFQVMVATDVISRGIDIDGIDLIINFDVPDDAEDYIHRVGRTARASATGVALTFINDKDQGKFHRIESLIGEQVYKAPLPPGLGEAPAYSPHTRRSSKGEKFFHKKKKGQTKYKKN